MLMELIDQVSVKREKAVEDLHTLQMLQLARDSPYAHVHASHRSSCTGSNSATRSHQSDGLLSALTTYTGSHYASARSTRKEPTATQWNYYTNAQKEVLCEVWSLILFEMVNEVGWPVLSS